MESTDNDGVDGAYSSWNDDRIARCRRVVSCLETYTTPMALADLAAEVAKRESGQTRGKLTPEEIHPTYISLYHSDIPKLVDEEVVETTDDGTMVMLAGTDECRSMERSTHDRS